MREKRSGARYISREVMIQNFLGTRRRVQIHVGSGRVYWNMPGGPRIEGVIKNGLFVALAKKHRDLICEYVPQRTSPTKDGFYPQDKKRAA